MNFLRPERQLICVLGADAEPAVGQQTGSPLSLAECGEKLRAAQPELRAMLHAHGGVLLRGLPVDSARSFETLAAEFLSVQEPYVGGVSRRSRIHNNVYNTTEAPSNLTIEQHLEATHTPRPPGTILFNCQQAPLRAGETPLASFVELFEALPTAVTEPLLDEEVVYTRELMDRQSRLYRTLPASLTQSLALSWQEVSGSEDYVEAQSLLATEGYEVERRGARRLRTRCAQPVVSAHPYTGAMRWYLSDQITRPLPWLTALGRRLLRSQLGMEFGLASGREIPRSVLELVHDTLARLRFSFSWTPGDVLVLDNNQMSHGRNPFAGERLILTAFG